MLTKCSLSRKLKMLSMYKHVIFRALCIGVLAFSLTACEPRYAITTTHTLLQLGDSTIDVVLYEASSPGLTYLNLHDNENTSVLAGLDVIGEYGGRVFELKHSGERRITFQLGGSSYEFDPNRMFTEEGCAASLERFGNVSNEAVAAVREFADELLQLLNIAELDVLVTLHNTQSSGTILSYTTGGVYEEDVELTHVSDEMDQNDYYFVIDRFIFDQLSQMDQNVVLQDNENVTNDGSLSVWSAQQELVYINVEAQNGHRRAQAAMLLRVHEIFHTER